MIKPFFFIACILLVFTCIPPESARTGPVINNNTFRLPVGDSIPKEKELSLLQKLIKPFKFKANQTARTQKIIQDVLNKDSVAYTGDISELKKAWPEMNQKIDQLKLQLDSIYHQGGRRDTVVIERIVPAGGDTSLVPNEDTTAALPNKEPQTEEDAGETPPASDEKVQQQKMNLVRLLYKAPVTIQDTSAERDSVFIKEINLSHKAQVLGFYADTSDANIRSFNFRLLTTLVYATNQVDPPAGREGSDNNISIIDSAHNAGCKVVLSVYNNKASSLTKLLTQRAAMDSFIQRSIRLLREHKASGINIAFNGLNEHQHTYFLPFIAALYEAYLATSEHFRISITVPAADKGKLYDLVALDKYVNAFIIDFTSAPTAPGAIDPLDDGSNTSIRTCFALYLEMGVPASKFILGLPYRGVIWQNQPTHFLQSIPYNQVRANYSDLPVAYEKGAAIAYLETNYQKSTMGIWYDDENTLGEKYDFALNNALGGVAVKWLGDDAGYGELQQELAYKFLNVDTSTIGTILIKYSFSARLDNFLHLLVENPCDQHVHPAYARYLLIINIILILILLAGAGIRFYQVKKNGEKWKWRKKLAYALIGLFALWTLLFLMWLFFAEWNPFFGPSNGKEDADECINISFAILCLILVTGTLTGIFIRWIYQMNNNQDKP